MHSLIDFARLLKNISKLQRVHAHVKLDVLPHVLESVRIDHPMVDLAVPLKVSLKLVCHVLCKGFVASFVKKPCQLAYRKLELFKVIEPEVRVRVLSQSQRDFRIVYIVLRVRIRVDQPQPFIRYRENIHVTSIQFFRLGRAVPMTFMLLYFCKLAE